MGQTEPLEQAKAIASALEQLADQLRPEVIRSARLDQEGRLTYMAEDGSRRVIVGDAELFERLQQLNQEEGDEPPQGTQLR